MRTRDDEINDRLKEEWAAYKPTGSQAYWQERWKGAPSRYDASWPDFHARQLELRFIESHLEMDETGRHAVPTLELGCGPFTLSESPRLVRDLRGYYAGVDSSPAAIVEAEAVAGDDGFQFMVTDLEAPTIQFPLPGGQNPVQVISRRVIQNLQGPGRQHILNYVARTFPFAILIEGSRRALEATNRLRNRYSLAPLIEPAFNRYLSPQEEDVLLEAGFERVHFMSTYYYRTRGCRQLAGFNTPEHQKAYEEALVDQTGELGPNVGFVVAKR